MIAFCTEAGFGAVSESNSACTGSVFWPECTVKASKGGKGRTQRQSNILIGLLTKLAGWKGMFGLRCRLSGSRD